MSDERSAEERLMDERSTGGAPVDHHLSSTSTLIAPDTEVGRTRSDVHVYERVPATEQEAEPSISSNTEAPSSVASKYPGVKSCNNAEAGTLSRSPLQWWFLIPLDVVLALSPLFFLGTYSTILGLVCAVADRYCSRRWPMPLSE
jgi:hypothetical protein